MKPILEMNDEELYEFYLDKKYDETNPIIDDMKNSHFNGRSKTGYSDYERDDVIGDYRIENDVLIFTVK